MRRAREHDGRRSQPGNAMRGAVRQRAHGHPHAGRSYAVGLWGDLPYDDVQTEGVPRLIADMNGQDLAFSVHDGDLKAGSGPCPDSLYTEAKARLNSLEAPAMFTPGDNDWTDCDRTAGTSSAERLAFERTVLFDPPFSLGQQRLRQRWHETPRTSPGCYDTFDEAQRRRAAAGMVVLRADPSPRCTATRTTSASTSRCWTPRGGACRTSPASRRSATTGERHQRRAVAARRRRPLQPRRLLLPAAGHPCQRGLIAATSAARRAARCAPRRPPGSRPWRRRPAAPGPPRRRWPGPARGCARRGSRSTRRSA